MNILNRLQQLSEEQTPEKADKLARITELARQQVNLEQIVEQIEEQLSTYKASLKRLSEETLPIALQDVGLTQFKLEDGSLVDVQTMYFASINDENRTEAFNWLQEKGFDDLIKNQISLSFGRGEDERAEELANKLSQEGYEYEQRKEVHPQTLKAFVKEQIEKSVPDFPLQTFKVFIGKKTKVKLNKSRKDI